MSRKNGTRSGCKDVFHAFLVKNANYDSPLEIPCLKTEMRKPHKLIAFSKAVHSTDGNYVSANIVVVIQKDNGRVTYKIVTVYPDKKGKENKLMKELDVVKLTKEFNGLTIGTEGTIVLEYDGNFFEVEFFNSNGDTMDVLTTPVDALELVN